MLAPRKKRVADKKPATVPAEPAGERRPPVKGLPRIGVAFGGGGARGLAHIHVIRELDALGIRPVAISGSSIGAIMGAAMAAGMSGDEIHDHARDVLSDKAQAMTRLWRARPTTFNEFLERGIRFSQFDVEPILKSFMPHGIPRHFSELEIPLTVTATDFFAHTQLLLRDGDLYPAIAASAAIPAIFRPVRLHGRLLIDGGIYNPLPIDVFGDAVDMVIAIDVVGAPEETPGRNPSSIDVMFGATQLMMQSIIAMKVKAHPPAILLRPPVSKFRVLDFLKIERVLAETEPLRGELRTKLLKSLPQLAAG